jgi:hypothetical protein
MVVDVIDIRKRIQRIRNDVSDALIARHEPQPYEEQLSPDAELSVLPAEIAENRKTDEANKEPSPDNKVKAETPAQAKAISSYRGVSHALSMPSFNLNITNRHSSTLLISLIILQLVSNLILITLLMIKLG